MSSNQQYLRLSKTGTNEYFRNVPGEVIKIDRFVAFIFCPPCYQQRIYNIVAKYNTLYYGNVKDGIGLENLRPGMPVHVTLCYNPTKRMWHANDLVLEDSPIQRPLYRDRSNPVSVCAPTTSGRQNTASINKRQESLSFAAPKLARKSRNKSSGSRSPPEGDVIQNSSQETIVHEQASQPVKKPAAFRKFTKETFYNLSATIKKGPCPTIDFFDERRSISVILNEDLNAEIFQNNVLMQKRLFLELVCSLTEDLHVQFNATKVNQAWTLNKIHFSTPTLTICDVMPIATSCQDSIVKTQNLDLTSGPENLELVSRRESVVLSKNLDSKLETENLNLTSEPKEPELVSKLDLVDQIVEPNLKTSVAVENALNCQEATNSSLHRIEDLCSAISEQVCTTDNSFVHENPPIYDEFQYNFGDIFCRDFNGKNAFNQSESRTHDDLISIGSNDVNTHEDPSSFGSIICGNASNQRDSESNADPDSSKSAVKQINLMDISDTELTVIFEQNIISKAPDVYGCQETTENLIFDIPTERSETKQLLAEINTTRDQAEIMEFEYFEAKLADIESENFQGNHLGLSQVKHCMDQVQELVSQFGDTYILDKEIESLNLSSDPHTWSMSSYVQQQTEFQKIYPTLETIEEKNEIDPEKIENELMARLEELDLFHNSTKGQSTEKVGFVCTEKKEAVAYLSKIEEEEEKKETEEKQEESNCQSQIKSEADESCEPEAEKQSEARLGQAPGTTQDPDIEGTLENFLRYLSFPQCNHTALIRNYIEVTKSQKK